jgi:hypothetical protein
MKEINDELDDSEEETDSDESELDDDEPIIIRPHKHNLRKKTKINYSESSKKQKNLDKESATSDDLIKRVLIKIVETLHFYWKDPNQYMLISTILDPKYKNLTFLLDSSNSLDLKSQTETELQIMFDDLNFELNPNINMPAEETTEIIKTSSNNEDSIFNVLFGSENQYYKKTNEVDNYINESITEKAEPNTNPYIWWNSHKNKFPVLSILARKFLSIPATSVPSEQLFSDAGNNMTSKRTALKPKFFQELLFVKRNSKYINIFELLANAKK